MPMKNNNKFRLDIWGGITLFIILLYMVFMIFPMGYLIIQSVIDGETGQFTLQNFAKFFSKSYYLDTLLNSFKVSIAATACALAIGTPLAYLFSTFKIRGKGALSILIIVASMSAPFIGAYSWILLLGRSGNKCHAARSQYAGIKPRISRETGGKSGAESRRGFVFPETDQNR